MQPAFNGKTVIVTGAGRGFGKRTAERFFEEGANLVLSDFDDAMLANALTPFANSPDRVVGVAGDIGREETSIALTDLAQTTFGGLDIAINNAGIVHSQLRLADIDSQTAEKVIQVDLLGVFYAMKHQLPLLVKQHQETGKQGNIVNIASSAGLMGSPMLSAYAAAKHGVVGLTKSAAIEYARKGIRINAVCPTFSDTDMARSALKESRHGEAEAEKRLVSVVPISRLGTIDEIVQSILWVCSPQNSFYTAQALAVDGGLTSF